MCFALPKKVKEIKKGVVFMEDGQEVKLGKRDRINPGDYLLVYGNIIVEKIDKKKVFEMKSLVNLST